MLPGDLRLHIENPDVFRFDKTTIYLELKSHIPELLKRFAPFLLSIEANEIAVIQYDHLRNKLFFEVDDLQDLMRDFAKFFGGTSRSDLTTNRFDDLDQRCEKICHTFDDITAYLSDYRIVLMNQFLGDIFNAKVPEREPLHHRKTLTEIAIKEEVEKEAKERAKRPFKGG